MGANLRAGSPVTQDVPDGNAGVHRIPPRPDDAARLLEPAHGEPSRRTNDRRARRRPRGDADRAPHSRRDVAPACQRGAGSRRGTLPDPMTEGHRTSMDDRQSTGAALARRRSAAAPEATVIRAEVAPGAGSTRGGTATREPRLSDGETRVRTSSSPIDH